MNFGQSAPQQTYTQLPTRPPGNGRMNRMSRNNSTGTSRRDLDVFEPQETHDLDVSFIPNRGMARMSTMTESAENGLFREIKRDEARKKRRAWIALIGINLLIGAAVGGGYTLYRILRHRHSNKNIQNVMASSVLGPPPNDIHIACSIHSLRTEFGIMACRDACQPAECCLRPLADDRSCLLSNRLECEGYSSCLNLSRSTTKQVTIVPAPPANLGSVCEGALNNDGLLEQCQRLCEVANCCVVSGGSGGNCIAENMATCGEYYPCFVLLNDDDIIPNLEEVTSTTLTTRPQGQSFSQGFNPYKSGDVADNSILTWDTTKETNVEVEEVTRPANEQNPLSITESVVETSTNARPNTLRMNPSTEASDLQTLCSPSNSDLRNCALKCDKWKCCFTTSANEIGCRDTYKPLCDQYQPCEILYPTKEPALRQPDVLPTTLGDTPGIRAPSTTKTTRTAQCVDTVSSKGLMDCQEFCRGYKCCFMAGEGGCGNDARMGMQCFEHRSCEEFSRLMGQIEPKEEEATQILKTQKATQSVENPVTPIVTSRTNKIQPISTTQQNSYETVPADVFNLVDEEPLTTQTTGKPLTPTVAMPLKDSASISTQPINDTSNTIPTNAAQHLADEIAYVCSPSQISKGGHAACRNGCQAGSCCFTTAKSVNCTQAFCDTYQPCLILSVPPPLVLPNDQLSDLPTATTTANLNAATACNPQSMALYPSLCATVCEDHMCCFGRGRNSCVSDPTKRCEAYTECAVLEQNGVRH